MLIKEEYSKTMITIELFFYDFEFLCFYDKHLIYVKTY